MRRKYSEFISEFNNSFYLSPCAALVGKRRKLLILSLYFHIYVAVIAGQGVPWVAALVYHRSERVLSMAGSGVGSGYNGNFIGLAHLSGDFLHLGG